MLALGQCSIIVGDMEYSRMKEYYIVNVNLVCHEYKNSNCEFELHYISLHTEYFIQDYTS